MGGRWLCSWLRSCRVFNYVSFLYRQGVKYASYPLFFCLLHPRFQRYFFDTLLKIGEACTREPSALLAVSAPWQCARSALSCRTFPQLALCHDITIHAFLSRRPF